MKKLTYTCATCGSKFKAWATQGYANCPECRGSDRVKRANIQCPTCKGWRQVSVEHKKRLKGRLTQCPKCLGITRTVLLNKGRAVLEKPVAVASAPKIATPCGCMTKAREGKRCTGYKIVGGCEHYTTCIDLAIEAGWGGWKVEGGKR